MRQLKSVSQDKVFYVFEGPVIKNLYELAEALLAMSQKSFSHHVNSSKNDFANWVRDVVDDAILALRLSAQRDKREMEKIVKARIKELEIEHMPAHASKNLLKSGAVDFTIGLVVGIIAGLILASLL